MKLASIFSITALSLALQADSYSGNDKQSMDTPVMRLYHENETGLMYTFSRVNLGGLNEINLYQTLQVYTDTLGNTINNTNNKNFRLDEANQFTFNYLQTLGAPDVKVFFDLDYLHADGYSHVSYAPYNAVTQPISYTITLHPILGSSSLANTTGTYGSKISLTSRSHFDLADTQAGTMKRFYRTKNIDFSVMGGLDLSVFSFVNTLTTQRFEQTSTQTSAIGEQDFITSLKSRYYGAGPLAGALFQVPFAHDALRLNLKVEGSLLMGYGSSYTRRETTTDNPYTDPTAYIDQDDRQRHTFRMVPTVRATVSMDIIIKDLMITGGLQQAVYINAFDINPLEDINEFSNDVTCTRSRLGNIVTGGPFVKLSYLF